MKTNLKTKVQSDREIIEGLLFEPGSKRAAHNQGVSTGYRLRTLEGLEEFFWLSEVTNPHPAMVVAEVEGRTTVDDWRRALDEVAERYPLLSVRIRKERGERPYFETVPDAEIPLRVVALEGVDLDYLAAEETVTSFGYGDSVLARATLCHSAERCVILFSAHHAITDGKTNVRIVEDLVAAASGEYLAPRFPVLPALGEFFGLGEPGPYVEVSAAAKAPASYVRFDMPVPRVERHHFEASDLKAVWATANEEGTTVHGALLAAFLLAGRQLAERWRTSPVVCLSPIDLRPMLELYGVPGPIIGVHPSVMQPSDNLPFWEFARALKKDMLPSQTKEVTAKSMKAVRDVLDREGDPDDPKTIDPEGFFKHDLMISNYGDPGVRTNFGRLTLRALYPSVVSGVGDTQTISMVTVDGTLYITHASRQPFRLLVEDALAILRDACAVSSLMKGEVKARR
jgi:hypothetical protein